MSESKEESKELFGRLRAPDDAKFECNNSSVVEAMQEVKKLTENTSRPTLIPRDDCLHQSIDNVIKFTKERCEALETIADRSSVGLVANVTEMNGNAADTISKLHTLLRVYRTNLALLLQGKLCFYLSRGEYMEAYYYANELESVSVKISDAQLIRDTKYLLSKKFVESSFNISNQRAKSYLYEWHARILQNNLQFVDNLKRHELATQEYVILRELFAVHITRCDFQFTLDLGNRLLEIACKVQHREMIITMLAEFGNLYLLLGKYQLAYDIMKEMLDWEINDLHTKCILICNFGVVELLLGYKIESLQHAWDSLDLALQTTEPGYIACAYGNIGLALEYMGIFDQAIEPYEKCLKIGEESGNYRVINNGLCNLGRAYLGLGDIQKAKDYFQKAIMTPRPSKAYWCDTEEFRFSGDYLLAKLAVQEKRWNEARKQFIEVIKRCENLRKSIHDSPIKITFNDTQRKPFQYLQHVLLEQGNELEALIVAEKGRGRDFFDKIEDELSTHIDSQEVLLDMIKMRSIAVMFISVLPEVEKLCLWFISSEGKLLKHWSIPIDACDEIFTKLCVELYKTQGRHEIEFRGTAVVEISSLIHKAIKIVKQGSPRNSKTDLTTNSQSCKNLRVLDATRENKIQIETSHFSTTAKKQDGLDTQESVSENKCSLPDLINQLSELILSPFQKELENVVKTSTSDESPRLLIIPQGQTFNIPFAALKLNEKPLCNHVTIIEAFSLNSFAYSTTESEKNADSSFEDALIVGNPTNADDLPRAEEEAKSIAEFLGVTPLVRDQATKEAVTEKLPNAQLIHFACHGEVNGNGLVLACGSQTSYEDCHLTAEDVESVKLNADLVVLSACHTARGKINSEGVLGLARAFQIAGARSVVTALWAIPDDATKYFMRHFYDYLRCGHPVADAIRATQVEMLESKSYNDVINWGSFKVFGANAKIM